MDLFKRVKTLIRFWIRQSKMELSPPFLIETKGQIISKGRESYHNGNLVVKGSGGVLEIGSYCAIGADVKIILSNHDVSNVCMQYTFYRKNFGVNINNSKESLVTIIENDVWIGDNVIILPGVKIGTGAVLGAAAVVTKDVEPYAIVGGNPAKLIRKRFSDDRIKELLDSKWWEWDDEKIKMNRELFIK
ncbi:MAG: CatB-related O-acetyltransferase [Flavobacteriaceae bacterium]|jgi:virginiamycin A acetyltransferase|nr:CatB-related O-acetyltransferase [Flavobacteriaceae bacterium]